MARPGRRRPRCEFRMARRPAGPARSDERDDRWRAVCRRTGARHGGAHADACTSTRCERRGARRAGAGPGHGGRRRRHRRAARPAHGWPWRNAGYAGARPGIFAGAGGRTVELQRYRGRRAHRRLARHAGPGGGSRRTPARPSARHAAGPARQPEAPRRHGARHAARPRAATRTGPGAGAGQAEGRGHARPGGVDPRHGIALRLSCRARRRSGALAGRCAAGEPACGPARPGAPVGRGLVARQDDARTRPQPADGRGPQRAGRRPLGHRGVGAQPADRCAGAVDAECRQRRQPRRRTQRRAGPSRRHRPA